MLMQDTQRFSEACSEGGVVDGNFGTARIGETVRLETGVD